MLEKCNVQFDILRLAPIMQFALLYITIMQFAIPRITIMQFAILRITINNLYGSLYS